MVRSKNIRRVFLFGLAGSLILCAVFAIYVVIAGAYNDLSGRVLLTTFSIGFYSLIGLCCTPHLEQHSTKRPIAYAGIAVSIIGLLFACVTNWTDAHGWSKFASVLQYRFFFAVLAITMAHASLLLIITPRNNMVKVAQISTVACVVTLGTVILGIICIPGSIWAAFGQPIVVLAILVALGSITTPILHAASKP